MDQKGQEFTSLPEDIKASPLYSDDLASVPPEKRTWNTWSLAAIWVGMAVCIPTYLLAASMISQGLHWATALIIIALANLVITLPMVLNGHAGVKYGVPFPVIGRAAFGTKGIHAASIVRALVACGWFGIQTWIGGLAIYAIWNVVMGYEGSVEPDLGQFVCFGIFWLINAWFIWRGTESIKWLEVFSAPILILIGVLLIGWGAQQAGGFGIVLDQSAQLQKPTGILTGEKGALELVLDPLEDKEGRMKVSEFQLAYPGSEGELVHEWSGTELLPRAFLASTLKGLDEDAVISGKKPIRVQFRSWQGGKKFYYSSFVDVFYTSGSAEKSFIDRLWTYIIWLTLMVGFWATMAISIADITRYVKTQREQVRGQFIGLPGTMVLYSFVGIFVTCAAVINFDDILVGEDAPWNPVDLLAKFESPVVVIIAQVFMLIATLSTNIAANVIAPANAFSNLFPKNISFRAGGMIAAIIGILTCPWAIMGEITNILLFVSGLLGPVLGILISDYYLVRKKKLDIAGLFRTEGPYTYQNGINVNAMIALTIGIGLAVVGSIVPALDFLYSLSWFTGFAVSLLIYYLLMRGKKEGSPAGK